MRSLLPPLLLFLGACTVWRPVTLPTPQDSTWSMVGDLRLTTSDGHHVQGSRVAVRGDSLLLTGAQGATVAVISRDPAPQMERQGVSGGRTATLLGALAAVVVVAVLAAGNSLSGFGGGGYGY